MNKKKLEELFYSKEMEDFRLEYYIRAYRQGRFDQSIKNAYPSNDYISKIKPLHLQSEEYQLSTIRAMYEDEDE